jgi:hypothetical protein
MRGRRLLFMAMAAALGMLVLLAVLTKGTDSTGGGAERGGGTAVASSQHPQTRSEPLRSRTSLPLPAFVPARQEPAPHSYKAGADLSRHDIDSRDVAWAPVMEQALRARFDNLPAWLTTLTVHEVECRTRTCRLEVRYPLALAEAVSRRAIDEGLGWAGDEGPIGFLIFETGPLSHASRVLSHDVVSDHGSPPTYRKVVLLGFDRQRLDQTRYAEWVAAGRADIAAVKQKYVDIERERAAAAAGGYEDQWRRARAVSAATGVGRTRPE